MGALSERKGVFKCKGCLPKHLVSWWGQQPYRFGALPGPLCGADGCTHPGLLGGPRAAHLHPSLENLPLPDTEIPGRLCPPWGQVSIP